MKTIELTKVSVEANAIHYQVCQENGLDLLQNDTVNLFIKYHGDEHFNCDLTKVPKSILMLPISLYLIPLTYFYRVELVIPEMDSVLYNSLPAIYDAYSKIYGPFKDEWRGKLTINKIVENAPINDSKYDKIVFFSGGVDACHAGINNSGNKSLLVTIPDIECLAKNEGPLREEKFSLIKSFSKAVNSDWLLISNNFNLCLYKDKKIHNYLGNELGLNSEAAKCDGWYGIKYVPNMCCVAPVTFFYGITSLIMGSAYEQIEDRCEFNLDGANPIITDSICFVNTSFAEQEGLMTRRSEKVRNIIRWCKGHSVKTKIWACFSDGSSQCGHCMKCVRTQLNLLCVAENPKDWGFDNFNEKELTKYVKLYKYREFNPCWLWDIIEPIDANRVYPFCNDLLQWLRKLGYKKYHQRSQMRTKLGKLKNFLLLRR